MLHDSEWNNPARTLVEIVDYFGNVMRTDGGGGMEEDVMLGKLRGKAREGERERERERERESPSEFVFLTNLLLIYI